MVRPLEHGRGYELQPHPGPHEDQRLFPSPPSLSGGRRQRRFRPPGGNSDYGDSAGVGPCVQRNGLTLIAGNDLAAGSDVELFVNPLDVGVDGGDADGEFGRDFLLGETIDELFEHLSLSGRQSRISLCRVSFWCWRGTPEDVNDLAGNRGLMGAPPEWISLTAASSCSGSTGLTR